MPPELPSLDATIDAVKLQYHRLDEPEDMARRNGQTWAEATGAPALTPIIAEMRRIESEEIAALNERITALGYRHRVSVYIYAPPVDDPE